MDSQCLKETIEDVEKTTQTKFIFRKFPPGRHFRLKCYFNSIAFGKSSRSRLRKQLPSVHRKRHKWYCQAWNGTWTGDLSQVHLLQLYVIQYIRNFLQWNTIIICSHRNITHRSSVPWWSDEKSPKIHTLVSFFLVTTKKWSPNFHCLQLDVLGFVVPAL